ncbi:glycolate oxidase [Leucobacter exalbidus]|uniref:Glycolate oxidase n=1 Tax=Leucobacter exalbidus TaxID=662960 RepID=A0A940T4I5_9MICO|nr:FAD-linked oxidase C-terminal domain-containing protein [Leucobacter exalbidus]MBP1327272.1 glycolate oxidase [Leucobacter exalbidus]
MSATFSNPSPAQITELRQLLGDRVVTDPAEIDAAAHDRSRYAPEGASAVLVRAGSTADVSCALAWAHEHRVPVAVRGAGTGVSGGAVGYPGGLIISLTGLNQITRIDEVNRLADVQAGVITSVLDRAANEHGLFFPPDPASVEISTVGGNIATNAGGLRCIAHGVTRDAVAALEVVLADGTVINTGARTRKNVVGLDLTSLFVGSEGTLGVITAATVRLKPIPPGTPHTFRANFDDIVAAGEAITAIVGGEAQPEVLELLDAASVRVIEAFHPTGLNVPNAAVLIGQTVGADAAHLADLITQTCAAHGATDLLISQSDSLLEARRLANPALTAQGLRVSCDVGVPVGELANVFRGIAEISERHGRAVSIVAHAGDGNLHPTVEAEDTPEGYAAAELVIDDITRLAISLGGTMSGEHGIGAVKHHELSAQLSDAVLGVQRSIKQTLDPHNILSPGRAI